MHIPYLSVVVTSRNDNHGESLLRRMQAFVNGFVGQCRRHDLSAELIFVEWNPPEERPRLMDVLEWPADLGPCRIRIIEVPESIHRRHQYADKLPLFQMIAKNVGIRRARGEFVLATNIDILFSDELFRFFADKQLRAGCSYRMDRNDIETMVPVQAPVEAQLAYCRSHMLRVFADEAIYPLTSTGERQIEPNDILGEDAGVRLGRGWYSLEAFEGERYRWMASRGEIVVDESRRPGVLSIDVESGDGVRSRPVNIELHDEHGLLVSRGLLLGSQRLTFELPAHSSRFTLTTREGAIRSPWPWDLRWLNVRIFRISREPGAGTSVGLNCRATELARRREVDIGIARFGRGWRLPEGDERFRWAFGEAVLEVPADQAGEVLEMEIEPGPGLGVDNFHLQVHDANGGLLGRSLIQGRQIVQLTAAPGVLVLRAEEAEPIVTTWPECTALPTFRLFDVRWNQQAPHEVSYMSVRDAGTLMKEDIAPADMGVRFGSGWHGLEVCGGEKMRWAGANAMIWLREPAATLHVEIEPGPSVAGVPMHLEVRSEANRLLTETAIVGRQTLQIPVPGGCHGVTLHCTNGGKPVPGDDRICNFRAFHAGTRERHLPCAPTIVDRVLDRVKRFLTSFLDRGPTAPIVTQPKEEAPSLPAVKPAWLHTNACGDFQLLARDDWFRVRGYPELQVHSLHLDSLFCYVAHYAGLKQIVLEDPMRIYHIEHGFASGWTPEGGDAHIEKMRKRGIGVLSFEEILDKARAMHVARQAILDNDENWGLALEDLHELEVKENRPARSA